MKQAKVFFALLLVLIGLTTIAAGQPVTPPPVSIIPGDVNSDKAVNIVDALLIARYAAALELSGFETRAADVNGSGAIDIRDALIIAQYSAGYGTVVNLITIAPAAGPAGAQIAVTGIQFDPTGNIINFIDMTTAMPYYNLITAGSADGIHLTFTIPAIVHPYCYYDSSLYCNYPDRDVDAAGYYFISVQTGKGKSIMLPFKLTAGN